MAVNRNIERRYDELYTTYGKPLEPDHWGQFLAVSHDGRTLLGSSLRQVIRDATAQFGQGNFIYKIGEMAVGKWR